MRKLVTLMAYIFFLFSSYTHADDTSSKEKEKRAQEEHEKKQGMDQVGDAIGRGFGGSNVNEWQPKPAQSGGTPPHGQKRKTDYVRPDNDGDMNGTPRLGPLVKPSINEKMLKDKDQINSMKNQKSRY